MEKRIEMHQDSVQAETLGRIDYKVLNDFDLALVGGGIGDTVL